MGRARTKGRTDADASDLAEQLTDAEARASAAEAERCQMAEQALPTADRIETLTAERDQARQELAACIAGTEATRRELLARAEAAETKARAQIEKTEAALHLTGKADDGEVVKPASAPPAPKRGRRPSSPRT